MRDKKVTFLTQAAMIAAIYVVLTFVFAPISFGEVQIRIAEMLTVLPVFTPAAIPGLFVGCLIGNITGGGLLPEDRKSTRLNSSHTSKSRMPSSA